MALLKTSRLLLFSLLTTLSLSAPVTDSDALTPQATTLSNDYTCRSTVHPNPILLLHGITDNNSTAGGLYNLTTHLQSQGYCTYSLTYGAHFLFPTVGGLRSVASSAVQISNFIRDIQTRTGAKKIDLVGHSEGAFMVLYTAKFGDVASMLEWLVAIAPPTHGTTLGGIYDIAYLGGSLTRELVGAVLDVVGCEACNDLGVGGPGVFKLNSGNITQAGNTVTVIASKNDGLITPTETAFVREDGVRNWYVQDFCSADVVKHMDEPDDGNVVNLVQNALEETYARSFACVASP